MQIHFPVELQQQIEAAILEGKLMKGQIVTVDELATVWAVPPDEMRQVLMAEDRKGLVQARPEDFEILGIVGPTLDSLFQHTSKAGMKPASDVRAAVIVPCTPEAAAKIAVQPGDPVYRLERTRIVNGEVLANQINYIPFEICPGLEHDDLSQYSFQKLLEGKYHTVIPEIEEDVRLAPASESDLAILGLPPGSEVIIVERLSFGATHRPVVWAGIHIRTDRYHYVEQLWPSAARLLESRQGMSAGSNDPAS
jgi:GntR family transcriptional regulator